jgi:hypothetical protein
MSTGYHQRLLDGVAGVSEDDGHFYLNDTGDQLMRVGFLAICERIDRLIEVVERRDTAIVADWTGIPLDDDR